MAAQLEPGKIKSLNKLTEIGNLSLQTGGIDQGYPY